MRQKIQPARDQLTAVLARRAAVSASSLAEQLGISLATLHRVLQEQQALVVATGKARRTRYALRMPLRGELAEVPLYQIDEAGRVSLTTSLSLVHPEGTLMSLSDTGWPVPDESRDGWWPGLPYPLYDMRPQGYMGRQFARAEHRQLAVSANPEEWNDHDVLYVLSRSGSDVSGNLILGDIACENWLRAKVALREPLKQRALGSAYAQLAEHAVAAGVAGSSAGREFPKFLAVREQPGSATPHVLVKFSGAEASRAVRRWADLLVCEHLALECAATLPGIEAAKSRIVVHAGRTFLEVERFDRHGAFGRSRLASLTTLNAALLGDSSTDWSRLATRFAALGLLAPDDVARVDHLWWLGRLIANTDMHLGNLSFRPQGPLTLAPAYDMLPMLYAPLRGGELPVRKFEPPLPLPPQKTVWGAACAAAVSFWIQASRDARIGEEFRGICASNARHLQRVTDRL
jgi:HipA-like C-terminal domain